MDGETVQWEMGRTDEEKIRFRILLDRCPGVSEVSALYVFDRGIAVDGDRRGDGVPHFHNPLLRFRRDLVGVVESVDQFIGASHIGIKFPGNLDPARIEGIAVRIGNGESRVSEDRILLVGHNGAPQERDLWLGGSIDHLDRAGNRADIANRVRGGVGDGLRPKDPCVDRIFHPPEALLGSVARIDDRNRRGTGTFWSLETSHDPGISTVFRMANRKRIETCGQIDDCATFKVAFVHPLIPHAPVLLKFPVAVEVDPEAGAVVPRDDLEFVGPGQFGGKDPGKKVVEVVAG